MSAEAKNKTSREEEKLSPECYQEDALYYDYYREEDEEGPYKTREQKLQRLKQLDNQEFCPWKLEEVYPNIQVTTREKLGEQMKQIEQFQKQTEYKEDGKSEEAPNNTNNKKEEEENDGSEK